MTASRNLRVDDSVLVEAVQAGDVSAYEELFRRHHTSVKRVCARRLGNPVEADEVAQAAFVRAFERIDRCIGDRRFGAWVQVIARRLCVDMIRARTRTTPDDDPLRNERPALNVVSVVDAGTATEEALVRRERTERIHEALALLPDRQRAVVVARHLEGRRPPEIAAALGLSVGAVDSLLLRARRRLAVNYEHVLAEGGPAAVPAAATAPAGAVSASAAAAGPPRVASVPDAVAGLMREVAVALPAGASLPAPVRRVVAAVVAAAVPAVSTVSAPAAPPPLSAASAMVAPTRAAARPPPLPGASAAPESRTAEAAAVTRGAGTAAAAPVVQVSSGELPGAPTGLAAVLASPQPASASAGAGAVVVPDLPAVVPVLAPPPPAAAEPAPAPPLVPAAPVPVPAVPPLVSSPPVPPVPVPLPPLPPAPAAPPALGPPG